MFNLGPEKLAILFLVALVVLGPEELPKAARKLGQILAMVRAFQNRLADEAHRFAESMSAPPPADSATHEPGGTSPVSEATPSN